MKKHSIFFAIISIFACSCSLKGTHKWYSYNQKKDCSCVFKDLVKERYRVKDRVIIQVNYNGSHKSIDTFKIIKDQMYMKKEGRYIKWLSVKAFNSGDTIYETISSPERIKRSTGMDCYIPHRKVKYKGKTLYAFYRCVQGEYTNVLRPELLMEVYFQDKFGIIGEKVEDCDPVFLNKVRRPNINLIGSK